MNEPKKKEKYLKIEIKTYEKKGKAQERRRQKGRGKEEEEKEKGRVGKKNGWRLIQPCMFVRSYVRSSRVVILFKNSLISN